jgi:hypothetical protein
MTLRPATIGDFSLFYTDVSGAWVIEVDGVIYAIGGMMRRPDGRVWAWIDTRPGVNPVQFVKAAKAALRSSSETVYVPCESNKFPTAEKLLRLLGFTPTEETHNDMRVWAWLV